MNKELLKKANELFDEPDIIIDLYDMTFVWMSDKLADAVGYRAEELIGEQIISVMSGDMSEKRNKAVEHMMKRKGVINVNVDAKNGDIVKIEGDFVTKKFKKGFYHIAKLIKYSVVTK